MFSFEFSKPMVSDEDLAKIGLYFNEEELYEVPEGLLFSPQKQRSLQFNEVEPS
jgi:hypothetical protein